MFEPVEDHKEEEEPTSNKTTKTISFQEHSPDLATTAVGENTKLFEVPDSQMNGSVQFNGSQSFDQLDLLQT